jgi:hypothetical protein
MVLTLQLLLRTSHAAFLLTSIIINLIALKPFPIYSLQPYSKNQNSATLILITTSQLLLSEGRAGPNNMTVFLSSPLNKESHQSSITFLPIHYSILFRIFLSLCQCSKSFLVFFFFFLFFFFFFFFKDILLHLPVTKTVSSIPVSFALAFSL